jgi:MFS family permease
MKLGIFTWALSLVWQYIFVLRSVERMGKGLRTAPRDTIIADCSLKMRGKAFGLHRAMDTLGAIGGSAIAFFLFYFLRFDFKPIFLLAGAVGICALIPLFWVKETRREPRIFSFKISLSQISRPLRWFILVATLFVLGNFSYMFFLLRIKEMVVDPWWLDSFGSMSARPQALPMGPGWVDWLLSCFLL